MAKVIATPKQGILVRHEDGKPLDADGEPVERTSYWLRRERDGDVTLAAVPAAAPEEAAPAETAAPAATKKAKS